MIVENAAIIVTVRAPKRRASTGMKTENTRIPSGDMAAFMPITVSEIPRRSSNSDNNG